MGRPRKEIIVADVDSINYIQRVISKYKELKGYCMQFEAEHPTLLCFADIHPEAFSADCTANQKMLSRVETSVVDEPFIEEYLYAKEQVYLLEHGVMRLDGIEKQVAQMLFMEQEHWSKVADALCVSKAALFRIRKTAILKIAVGVDSYMQWKVEQIYIAR